ncbi:MAG: DUF465 domain-containing protein [Pseudomonadota bacterium]
MSIEGRLAELERKHKALEDALSEEEKHAAPDAAKISDMKKEKLKIKEEIEKLRA